MSTAEDKALLFEDQTFGGPSSIEVIADRGQAGIRGTYFLISQGDPSNALTPPIMPYKDDEGNIIIATPKRYDICINLNPTDAGYLDIYYYEDGLGGILQWTNKFPLTPNSYPVNINFTFTSGTGTPTTPIIAPIPLEMLATINALIAAGATEEQAIAAIDIPSHLNFQFAMEETRGISSRIYYDTTPYVVDLENGLITLNLKIYAKYYNTSYFAWANLTGTKKVHLLITVI